MRTLPVELQWKVVDFLTCCDLKIVRIVTKDFVHLGKDRLRCVRFEKWMNHPWECLQLYDEREKEFATLCERIESGQKKNIHFQTKDECDRFEQYAKKKAVPCLLFNFHRCCSGKGLSKSKEFVWQMASYNSIDI